MLDADNPLHAQFIAEAADAIATERPATADLVDPHLDEFPEAEEGQVARGCRRADVLARCTVAELMSAMVQRIQCHIDLANQVPAETVAQYRSLPVTDFVTARRTAELVGMWFTRGLAKELGTFSPADLEHKTPAEASAFLTGRDARAVAAANATDGIERLGRVLPRVPEESDAAYRERLRDAWMILNS